MKRTLLLVIFVFVFADLPGLSPVHAQTGGGYDLTWWTVDSGGGMSVGSGSPAPYTLAGTAGQPDAGLALTGGGFTLVGGFWGGGASQYQVYLPLVIR